jgi:hypothetical protein
MPVILAPERHLPGLPRETLSGMLIRHSADGMKATGRPWFAGVPDCLRDRLPKAAIFNREDISHTARNPWRRIPPRSRNLENGDQATWRSCSSIASTNSWIPMGLATAGHPASSPGLSRFKIIAERKRIRVSRTRESERICRATSPPFMVGMIQSRRTKSGLDSTTASKAWLASTSPKISVFESRTSRRSTSGLFARKSCRTSMKT